MLRLRFTSGLILGLLIGVPAGLLIGLLALPGRATDPNAATSSQVQELSRKLEVAKEDKERVDRQLDQFSKLADQMTASFNSLERRFQALLEEQRLRDTPPAKPAVAAAPVAQAPTAAAPDAPQPTPTAAAIQATAPPAIADPPAAAPE